MSSKLIIATRLKGGTLSLVSFTIGMKLILLPSNYNLHEADLQKMMFNKVFSLENDARFLATLGCLLTGAVALAIKTMQPDEAFEAESNRQIGIDISKKPPRVSAK